MRTRLYQTRPYAAEHTIITTALAAAAAASVWADPRPLICARSCWRVTRSCDWAKMELVSNARWNRFQSRHKAVPVELCMPKCVTHAPESYRACCAWHHQRRSWSTRGSVTSTGRSCWLARRVHVAHTRTPPPVCSPSDLGACACGSHIDPPYPLATVGSCVHVHGRWSRHTSRTFLALKTRAMWTPCSQARCVPQSLRPSHANALSLFWQVSLAVRTNDACHANDADMAEHRSTHITAPSSILFIVAAPTPCAILRACCLVHCILHLQVPYITPTPAGAQLINPDLFQDFTFVKVGEEILSVRDDDAMEGEGKQEEG